MNPSSDQILSLFADIRSGVKEQIENASNELYELIKTPILGELCQIAATDIKPSIRYYSIVTIGRSLSVREYNIEPEESNSLKQFILEQIFKETNVQNCEYLISLGCKLYKKESDEESLELFKKSLIEAAVQLANDKIHVALYFIYELIENDIINEEIFDECNMAEICHKLILLGLQCEDKELALQMHKKAIDLLDVIYVSNICEGFLQSSEDIIQMLQTEAQFSIYSSSDDEESLKLFIFLYNVVSDDTDDSDPLGDSFNFFLKFTYETIRNQEISPIRREYALFFFNGAFLSQFDIFKDKLKEVIQITFDILLCKCKEDNETFQPCFSDRFLSDLASDPDSTDEVFSTLLSIAKFMKDSNDIIGFRVAVACLGYISESAQETYEANPEEVCEIIKYAINAEDQFVFAEVCNFISLLASFAFDSISPIFDDLANILPKCFKSIDALYCLEKLLDKSNRPPTEYDKYCGTLIELLNDQEFSRDRVYIIINCITSIIQRIESMDEDLYVALRPILIEIIQKDPDTRSNVYSCFSSCTKIACRAVSEDIEPYANAMIEDLTNNQQDLQIVFSIAVSVSILAEDIPQTLYSYAPGFFEIFQELLSQFTPEAKRDIEFPEEVGNEDDEEIPEYLQSIQLQQICGEILNCLSLLYAAYPNDLSSQFEFIFQTISDFLMSDKQLLAIGAANSIRAISLFLSEQEEFNPSTIIVPIIQKIEKVKNQTDNDLVLLQALFDTITTIAFDSGRKITDVVESEEKPQPNLTQFFVDCLSMNIHSIVIFIQRKKAIINEMQGFVMNSLAAFIIGGAFNNAGENKISIVNELIGHLNHSRKKTFQMYTICSLARICFVSPNATKDDLAPTLVKTILTLLSGDDKDITEICISGYFFALFFVFASHQDLMNNELGNQLRDIVLQKVNFDHEQSTMTQNSALLLLLLCSMFQVEIDPNLLAKILQIFPDSDDEGIPVYANCIYSLFNGNEEKFQEICNFAKIALIIALSPKWCSSMIPQNIFKYFVEIVKQIPENDLNSLLEYNQVKLAQYKKIIG